MKGSDIIRLTKTSRQTLHNWKKHKPELYDVVVIGCEAKLKQEQLQDSWYKLPKEHARPQNKP